MTKSASGQSLVELAVMLSVVVAALMAMHAYVHRAYQGYLYANASVHGQQFDPTKPNQTRQSMNQFTQHQTVDIENTEPSVTLPPGQSTELPSTPGGQLPGRVLQTKIRVDTDWDVSRDSSYEAR